MIRQFGQGSGGRVTRKGIAVLLVFWLNLALLPCAMAINAPETDHDCCPPSIEFQPSDCCELDAATADKRGGKFEAHDDLVVISTGVNWPSLHKDSISRHEARPPDPAYSSPPLHKLFCVYLD
jgi:hypothetical protein